jgi:3-methylfumaryl-CoA hydratase
VGADEAYREYVGRVERRRDVVTAGPLEGLAALLDAAWPALSPDGSLPPLWHWLFFASWARQSDLGQDGHPRRGTFLPPVDLPRRMFAGGCVDIVGPLFVGDAVERVATIRSVEAKTGASGPLVFVTVRHEVSGPRGLAIAEEQNIVYRGASGGAPKVGEAPPPVPAGAWVREVDPDPTLLFRFSALTANAHRIHYDRPYATGVEGYPGLVVHGPLQAILLLDLVRRHSPARRVRRFQFQARRPLFDIAKFSCVGHEEGAEVVLTTRDAPGHICVVSRVVFAD